MRTEAPCLLQSTAGEAIPLQKVAMNGRVRGAVTCPIHRVTVAMSEAGLNVVLHGVIASHVRR
jgi:hypothetical protein